MGKGKITERFINKKVATFHLMPMPRDSADPSFVDPSHCILVCVDGNDSFDTDSIFADAVEEDSDDVEERRGISHWWDWRSPSGSRKAAVKEERLGRSSDEEAMQTRSTSRPKSSLVNRPFLHSSQMMFLQSPLFYEETNVFALLQFLQFLGSQ